MESTFEESCEHGTYYYIHNKYNVQAHHSILVSVFLASINCRYDSYIWCNITERCYYKYYSCRRYFYYSPYCGYTCSSKISM